MSGAAINWMRRIEWSMGGAGQCPECCGLREKHPRLAERPGHKPGCELGRALESLGEKVQWRDELESGPVRLCCGKRHLATECPDGKVMCCLCFGRFKLSELNESPEGKKEDVCKKCAAEEKLMMERKQ